MVWAAVGVAAVGAVGSYSAAQSAAGAATDANNKNIAFQQEHNQQTDPFSTGGNRQQYVPQLNDLMRGGVAGVANDPGFKAMNESSLRGVDAMMAAKGQGVGTSDLQAINQQSQLNQNDYFQQQYQRLSALSGANNGTTTVQGMDPRTAGGIAQAGTNAAISGLSTIYGAYKGSQGPSPSPTPIQSSGTYANNDLLTS